VAALTSDRFPDVSELTLQYEQKKWKKNIRSPRHTIATSKTIFSHMLQDVTTWLR